MQILGIDPGLATVGYGVVEYAAPSRLKLIDYGIIETKPDEKLPLRLLLISRGIITLIERFTPDYVAFEELFFNKNVKTAINVAQARGAALAAARSKTEALFEYTPLQVKQAVVGYGRADKRQVQLMVKTILNINEIIKPDDAADAVAVAICHAYSARANSVFGGGFA